MRNLRGSALLLEAYSVNLVELHVHPPVVAGAVGERPEAGALARLQATEGASKVTNLRHRSIHIEDDLARRLLTLLDGTRDRAALLREVSGWIPSGRGEEGGVEMPPEDDLPEALDAALDRLLALSLLER